MKMTLFQDVEPGTYPGTFDGVSKTSHPEFGDGVRWDFHVGKGKTVCRTTTLVASNGNTCGRFWQMVSGLPLEEAIKHDTDDWVGVPGTVVVERSPSGGTTRVAKFVRDDAE